MDWSTVAINRLATGARNKTIHVWEPHEAGTWVVNKNPAVAHTDSVEDIQWSPSEANVCLCFLGDLLSLDLDLFFFFIISQVFASCSVDKTIKIWDVRQGVQKAALSVEAHATDVNVIAWNRREQHLLVSGADDGVFTVWNLRSFAT